MNIEIRFPNDQFLSFYLFGGLLLLLVFIFKELPGVHKKIFYLRILVAILAIGSLLGIALKPAYLRTKTKSKAVILTEGYSKVTYDSLKKQYPKIKTIEYNAGDFIQPAVHDVSKIYVLGYGLQDYDFFQFKNRQVVFLPAKLPSGIDRIVYNEELFEGEKLQIRGHYNQAIKANKIYLKDFTGSIVDSAALEKTDFSLKTNTKVAGCFLYRLEIRDSLGRKINEEPLPVKIKNTEKLKILIINNFPSFETRHLKDFLAEEGHQVSIRSKLTRERFKYEYLNTDKKSFSEISKASIEHYDVLILDAQTFNRISGNKKLLLLEAIRNEGLGLFIQQTEDNFQQKLFLNFETELDRNLGINWLESTDISISKFPYQFKNSPEVYPLVENAEGVSVYKYMGRGRIGTSVLQKTYELILKGHQEIYQKLWSETLRTLAKRKQKLVEWEKSTLFSMVDEPLNIKLQTRIEEPQLNDAFGNSIPLLEYPDLKNTYQATVYPVNIGWNRLELVKDSLLSYQFYVFNDTLWKTKEAREISKRNIDYFKNDLKGDSKTKYYEPINLWFFFIVFMAASGFLWLHPKLIK
ncbi:hypothetical protein [Zunongwangia sp. HRR-M8]|uniref:hypothetical protein n=1 Tax=Zunongwangia sp. HRR-M8 TaxID=3015170 RepID=UPI0022DE6F58|nr:hypothetical protein [Zunongwangia sp. HRR-M8]WBL21096.1 hypothetical protein PBT89_10165 [Zunongwangia sp. HRR-M8]